MSKKFDKMENEIREIIQKVIVDFFSTGAGEEIVAERAEADDEYVIVLRHGFDGVIVTEGRGYAEEKDGVPFFELPTDDLLFIWEAIGNT